MKGTFPALYLHCLRFDLVEGGPDRGSSRLYGGTLAASLLATVLAGQTEDLSAPVAVPILFFFTGVFAFFGILGEAAAALFDPRDAAFLGTLPVAAGAYFRARLLALASGLVLRVLSFGLVPSLVFSFGDRGPVYTCVFYLAALFLMFAVLLGCAIVLFMVLQRLFDPAWLRDAFVWLQVVLVVVGSAGWLLLFQVGKGEGPGLPLHWFSEPYVLSAWFASLCLAVTHPGSVTALALLPAGAALLLGAALLAWLGRGYLATLAQLNQSTAAGRTRRRGWLLRRFEDWCVSPAERAGFHLGRALLRRERTFRLQTYPLLAYPLLFLVFGRGVEHPELFGILFAHLGAMYLPLVSLFLQYSDRPEAAWVLALHRQQPRAALWSGARKALVLCIVLPLATAVTVLLIALHGAFFGLAIGASAGCIAVWVAVSGPPPLVALPFSQAFRGAVDPGRELSRVYPLFFLVVVLGILESFLWRAAPLVLPWLALAGVIFVVLRLRAPCLALDEAESLAAVSPVEAVREFREPFSRRLRSELRGLGFLYGALALFGVSAALYL